jgi:hypothetical protein
VNFLESTTQQTCSIEGCHENYFCKGLCRKHYAAQPQRIETVRAYHQQPHIKARQYAYRQRYFQRPDVKAKQKAYYLLHKTEIRAMQNRPENKARRRAHQLKPITPERRKKQHDYASKTNRKIKIVVLEHYSGIPPKCACCGESRLEFLSIDHINNDGAKQRKEIGKKYGSTFARWLIKNDFPDGYQILCFNCNCAKGFFGYCPHQKEREATLAKTITPPTQPQPDKEAEIQATLRSLQAAKQPEQPATQQPAVQPKQ